jgi:predicted DNA-binding transcriptional regulator AlpA
VKNIQRTYDSSDIYELFSNVARRLGFSRYGLREMCKAGEFPEPIRFGKRRLVFRRADVESWIRQREKRDWRKCRAVGESAHEASA